jgi:serine/threonine protein kinase
VLASLNHPNIAHIYGVEEQALVMELVEGQSPRGPMPFEEAWKIALQIADAPQYAHENGIVRRDLKPANIKVTPDGVVKLLDFGLAKAYQDAPDAARVDPGNSPTMTLEGTVPGVILGTAAYMAPEQARGKVVDRRADIWSFGVLLYELLTGKQLFRGEDLTETLANIIRAEPDFRGVPGRGRKVLEACLQKDPKKRLQSIGDVQYLRDDRPSAAVRTRQWPTVVLAAVAAVLLVVTVTVLFFHLREQPPERAIVRFQFSPPEKNAVRSLPLSPDGHRLALTLRG